MDKLSKILYILTVILIFLPVILKQVIDIESTFLSKIPWTTLFIVTGGSATILAILSLLNNKNSSLITLFLFMGLGLGIIGFGLKTLNYVYSNHIILAGLLFFLLWLLLPNKEQNETK